MKSYKQFMEESVNISGDFNGTLVINGSESTERPVEESFLADVVYNGSLYRLKMFTKEGIPSNQELTERLQDQYPGAIVHTIYSVDHSESNYKVIDSKRYHPSKLEWV